MVQRKGQMKLQNSGYGSSNIGVFSVTFMKCRHGSVNMQWNHGKVVTERDVAFWAIKVSKMICILNFVTNSYLCSYYTPKGP